MSETDDDPLRRLVRDDDPLRGLVRDWPYAREFVLDTMDPELIQRHGELLLSRAINIGRIVAFVGAGVSMSYGRISWRELVRELLGFAEQLYVCEQHKHENEHSPGKYEEKYPRINTIYTTLKALKPADEDSAWLEVSASRFVILFQIADELGEAIHRSGKRAALALNPVRRKAQQLVYDDAGHARRLFESSYKGREDEKKSGESAITELFGYLEKRPLSRDLSKVQPPYQQIFAKCVFDKIAGQIPANLALFKELCQQFGKFQAKSFYLNPTHRFIVAAVLATKTASESNQQLNDWAPRYRGAEQSTDSVSGTPPGDSPPVSETSIQQPIEARKPRQFREEAVDQERDPLQLMVNRLGVRRFITTNYDLDIERMILDRGYRLRSSAVGSASKRNFIAESVNAMEARARDFLFEEQRAAHLIDFAVQDGRFAIDIVHLHGRATDGDNIVATEADYQRLYLHDDSHKGRGRDLLDGAINLAFRGNALLFVGNGMGEDDLLRPLRNFMSEGPSGRESDAVALLPDMKGEQSRLEEKATLLRRYGVYTIHFGQGRLLSNGEPGKEEFLLFSLIKLMRFLAREIAGLRSRKTAAKPRGEAIRDLLRNIREELSKGQVEKGARESSVALSERLVVPPKPGVVDTLKLGEICQIEGQLSSLIDCELKTINYLLDFCVRAASNPTEHAIEARAAQILADNIEDAVVAGFLSATISRLQQTWAAWREEWFGDVSPRLPLPRAKPLELTAADAHALMTKDAQIDRRRAINLPPDYNFLTDSLDSSGRADATARARQSKRAAVEDGDPSRDGRFRIKTSQTLAQACLALSRHATAEGRKSSMYGPGRRVFVLAGARGTGKGHFFSALSEGRGLCKFLEATWRGRPRKPKYSSIFAFNFSFSVELGSGFDRLARFLRGQIDAEYRGNPKARKRFDELCEQIAGRELHDQDLEKLTPPRSGHRVGLLDFLFKVIAHKIDDLPTITSRFVLLFNATHLLFDAGGVAKSSDVTRIMNVLLDEQHKDARIDIVFVTDEKGIPIQFRNQAPGKPQKRNHVGIPRETPPAEWALEIVRSPTDHLRGEAEDDAAATRLGLRRKAPLLENVAIFLRLRPAMLGIVAAAAFPRTLAAIVCVARDEEAHLPHRKLEVLRKEVHKILGKQARKNRTTEGVIKRDEYARELAALGLAERQNASDDEVAKIDRELGTYFKAFGGNRFAMTVAFAVADEELVAEEKTKAAIGRTLGRIRDEVSGIDDPSREDTIVRAAIAIHRRRGVRRQAFPEILPKLVNSFKWKAEDEEHKAIRLFGRLSEVCEELLVVLSMIGYPIEQDCLATLRFRAWDDWSEDFGEKLKLDTQKAVVAAALKILVQRCLVFRFEPTMMGAEAGAESDRGAANPDKGTERFGVHRHVQRHVFLQLKQPFVEHAEIESYMPTLYASQPNDLPYPTITAQSRIREIVAMLSRYPSASRLHEPSQNNGGDGGDADEAGLQSRMLRAAYGAIRTVYGVGVVARFNEFGDESTPPTVGYFEEHRQQVRWLLKRSKEVERLLKESLKSEPAQERFAKFVQSLPFYSGDIAWLYNECGVLSLVQGRLKDASKLFSESMRALLPIERRGTPAALTASVRLNRALVDIELGNLPKAETALRDIIAQQDEHRAVRWIAFGYRGLIEHIRGNLKEAKSHYDGAVEALIEMKRNRAASIFSRHCADLYRHLKGEDNLKTAEALADNAVNLAAAGSHADVLHQARLSRLRIQAAGQGAASFAKLRKELEVIETYAKVMGMPRLEVETSYVDADFRCQLGDLTMAMKAITRSLAIANDCDLVLRKISGTILAAEISRHLGMLEGARTLAETAMVMATTAEFSAAQDAAQTLLASL
jgi:tetratricopeptide (TPR) repeat protein